MHVLCVAAAMASYIHRIRMRDIRRLYTHSGVSCSDANTSRACPDVALGCAPRVCAVSLVVASYIYSMQGRQLHRRDAQCATRIHMLWSVLQ